LTGQVGDLVEVPPVAVRHGHASFGRDEVAARRAQCDTADRCADVTHDRIDARRRVEPVH